MKRRKFFAALFGTGTAVAATVPKVTTIEPEASVQMLHHVGKWRVTWTGWKKPTWSNHLVGQWVAVSEDWGDPDAVGYYSSYPGACTSFKYGEHFNLAMSHTQRIIDDQSGPELVEKAKHQALVRLLEKLQEVGI